MNLKLGDKAPDFSAPDQEGKVRTLTEFAGKWVLLYFYPKDDTSGCTKQACDIRDNFPAFEKLNVQVLGVSADSSESHKQFEEKYQLPFTLLADEKKDIINAYGVWGPKFKFGRWFEGIQRTSFLIDGEGKIAQIWESVWPEKHVGQVLEFLKDRT